MSVMATAFSPPQSEYAKDRRANSNKPVNRSSPVSEFIANDPSHKTLVRFINT